MYTTQELRTVKYARTTLYLRTLRMCNTHVLRLRYVNFFLAPTVSCTNCTIVYIHTNDKDLFALIPYVFVYVTWIHSGSKLY